MTDSRREETIESRPPISSKLGIQQRVRYKYSIHTSECNMDIIWMNDLIGDFA
jgi:hypothetical protein